jgi:hypothetical protein
VLAAAEHDELVRLRHEVRQLKLERDMLAKAAAWSAQDTGTIPDLPVHEHKPSLLSGFPDGTRARRCKGWLLPMIVSAVLRYAVADAALLKRVMTSHASSRQT